MRRSALIAGMAVALLSGGCNSQGIPSVSSSLEEVTVKGVVRVRGKLVNNGSVTFNAANVRRPKVALRKVPIEKDGTYVVKTLVGENYVQVSCKELYKAKNRMLSENELMLMADAGENTFNIDIAPSGAGRPGAKSSELGSSSK